MSRVALALVVAACAMPAPSASAGAICDRGDGLFASKLLDLAEETYEQARDAGEGACAQNGLNTVKGARERVEAAVENGERLAKANPLLARGAYRRALRVDPYSEEARKGLEALLAPSDAPAAEKPKSWIKRQEKRADDFLKDLKRVGVVLVGVLAAFLVAYLALLALAWAGRPFFAGRTRRAWASRDRTKASRWLRFWNWVYRRNVRFAEFTASKDIDAAGFTAQCAAALNPPAATRRGTVDRVSSPSADPGALETFAKALGDVPRAKLVAAVLPLLRTLLPRTVHEVRGHVSAVGSDAILTLTLVRRAGAVIDSVVLRSTDLQLAPPAKEAGEPKLDPLTLDRLARAAAPWVRHALIDAPDRERELLGVDDWRSAVRFEAALAVRGDPVREPALYSEALDRDAGNQAARYNLALLDIRDGRHALAEQRLREVVGRTARQRATAPLGRPHLWFSASFNLGATQLYLAGPADRDRHRAAWKTARALVTQILLVRERLEKLKAADRHRWGLVLDGVEGSALVLLADALARFQGRPGTVDGTDHPQEWWKELADRLEAVADPENAAKHGLSGWTIAERYVERGVCELTPRTRYDLACFYANASTLGHSTKPDEAFLDLSLDELRRAGLELKARREWAAKDPDLAVFRDSADKTRQAEYERLTADPAATPPKARAAGCLPLRRTKRSA